MPDDDKNFGVSLNLDFRNDDVTCKPRIGHFRYINIQLDSEA